MEFPAANAAGAAVHPGGGTMRASIRIVPVLLVVLSLLLLLAPMRVQSVPLYAARTGLMCQSCHMDPNGGGIRNEFGFAFAKNRHMLVPEDSTSRWSTLDVTNRVGETMPLYFGVNQRFMLLANQHRSSDRPERIGFFNMESEIHLAFQPHDMLTLVYTTDGFATGPSNTVRSKEAYGMIHGLPLDGYIRAGRFRTPFGLRMDDHTVATRNGFGDFGTGGTFLPYDPRNPDMGIEVGGDKNNWFGRAAFTDGASSIFTGSPNAEAKTAKLGYNHPRFQAAASIYDDFLKSGTTPQTHFTRWGLYGLTHYQSFAFIGEFAAGSDKAYDYTNPDPVTTETKLAAWFGEADWAPQRQYNVRVRYDWTSLNDGAPQVAREAAQYVRYSLEGEWVPVPFAELRLSFRYLDPKDPTQDIERQAFLQFHFSY
jgi:hypothetical protein